MEDLNQSNIQTPVQSPSMVQGETHAARKILWWLLIILAVIVLLFVLVKSDKINRDLVTSDVEPVTTQESSDNISASEAAQMQAELEATPIEGVSDGL